MPLKPSTIELGVKASQLIIQSSTPLDTLQHLSQNFPNYATALSRRLKKDQEVSHAQTLNHGVVPGGTNVMWMNGILLQKADLNPFGYVV